MYRERHNYSGDFGFADFFARLSWRKRLGIGCLGLTAVWIGLGILLGGGSGNSGSATAGMSCNITRSGMESCTKTVGFDECLDTIRRTAEELGVAPDNIVETPGARVVRFPASDGSVLVTCSPDGQIAFTRSPYSG